MGYPRSYGVSAAPRLERHKKACILHGVSAIIGVHEGSWHSRGFRVDASDATQKERPWGIRGVHGVSAASMGYPRHRRAREFLSLMGVPHCGAHEVSATSIPHEVVGHSTTARSWGQGLNPVCGQGLFANRSLYVSPSVARACQTRANRCSLYVLTCLARKIALEPS